jgi:hypothetical protein
MVDGGGEITTLLEAIRAGDAQRNCQIQPAEDVL